MIYWVCFTVLHLYLISGMVGSSRYSKKNIFNVFSIHRCLLSISNSFSIRNEVGNKLTSLPVTSQLPQYQLLRDQFSSTGSPCYLYFILNYFMHLNLFLDLISASLICWLTCLIDLLIYSCTSSDLITVASQYFLILCILCYRNAI